MFDFLKIHINKEPLLYFFSVRFLKYSDTIFPS